MRKSGSLPAQRRWRADLVVVMVVDMPWSSSRLKIGHDGLIGRGVICVDVRHDRGSCHGQDAGADDQGKHRCSRKRAISLRRLSPGYEHIIKSITRSVSTHFLS